MVLMCDVYLHTRVPLSPLPSGTYTIDLLPVKRPHTSFDGHEAAEASARVPRQDAGGQGPAEVPPAALDLEELQTVCVSMHPF